MINEEVEGHVVSTLALSRSSSMTVPAIVKNILAAQPGWLDMSSRKEWEQVVREILNANTTLFGRIKRTGTVSIPLILSPAFVSYLYQDAASQKLEDQYYYDADNDPDQSRAEVFRMVMPKKRGCTKQHQQYYYEPVAKPSRWDPEDDF
jgi:hypothetical protein